MADVTVFGPAASSYVRTVRMLCAEKQIGYELAPVELKSEAHLELHPFGRVPVMRHEGVQLFETDAIARYLDEAFGEPSLVPDTVAERAQMQQWISTINCYIYDDLIRRYALQYIFPQGKDGKPDRSVIDAAIPDLQRDLRLLDGALEDGAWRAGDRPSLAALFLAPVLATIAPLPEASEALEKAPAVKRFMAHIAQRDSYREAHPPDLLG